MEQKLWGRGLERLVFFWQRARESGRRWWNRPREGRRNEMVSGFGRAKKTKDPLGGTAVSFPNKMRAGGCDSFGFKRVSGGCKLVGARKGEVV